MQALGSYKGGKLLFLGLGTGLKITSASADRNKHGKKNGGDL
jgi:hypothetical protein